MNNGKCKILQNDNWAEIRIKNFAEIREYD